MAKQSDFIMSLKTILGLYGVRRKDEFLNRFLPVIEDDVRDQVCGYCKQLSMDALAVVAVNHGYGKKRWNDLREEFEAVLDELDIMSEQESVENIRFDNLEDNGLPDIPVMKARLDRAIRPLYGDEFLEYDARYKKAQADEPHHTWDELKEMAKGVDHK